MNAHQPFNDSSHSDMVSTAVDLIVRFLRHDHLQKWLDNSFGDNLAGQEGPAMVCCSQSGDHIQGSEQSAANGCGATS